MSETALVTIRRTSEDDIKMRDLYVRIDDGDEINLKYGGKVELQVPLGDRHILATNRALKQQMDFTLTEAGATFEVANTAKGCLGVIFSLGIGPYACELRQVKEEGPA